MTYRGLYKIRWLAISDGGKIAVGGSGGLTFLDGNSAGLAQFERPFASLPMVYSGRGHFIDESQIILTLGKDIGIFDTRSAKMSRILEGHKSPIVSLQRINNGRFFTSRDNQGNAIFWDAAKWIPLAETRLKSQQVFVGNPSRNEFCSSTSRNHHPYFQVWQFDPKRLRNERRSLATTTTVSAKVVLVGETNVGKSFLAHRIVKDTQPSSARIKSTHGMRFWKIEPSKMDARLKSAKPKREIVIWDLGGQKEYRLVHQLFLADTRVALILLDPTRGDEALAEVETWNKYIERQLPEASTTRFLVGSKQEERSELAQYAKVSGFAKSHGFANYFETSARSGRGVSSMKAAIARAIDWNGLAITTRPILFQRVRDEIEKERRQGTVVLHVSNLCKAIPEADRSDIDTVLEHLAVQGQIARSKFSTGEPVVVLQVQEIERYAGSLILLAKGNPRNVPAIDLTTLEQITRFPGIKKAERLPETSEKAVLECTVQLMLTHGLCFEHEGLLVFPSLFSNSTNEANDTRSIGASLYYDFAGAIDNIYASLIASLVLAKDFGSVLLEANRAEFERPGDGKCGLKRINRPGGFAHLDVYFDEVTSIARRNEFIAFVEEHLQTNGLEITEQLVVPCPSGFIFDKETIQLRISQGHTDVLCPRCSCSHELVQGADAAKQKNAGLASRMVALRTQVDKRKAAKAKSVAKIIERPLVKRSKDTPIQILHLSDLHFDEKTSPETKLQWLLEDLKGGGGLGIAELDYLVISGDFTDRGNKIGFDRAYQFISGLTSEFGLSAERCIFVPGNHDVVDMHEAYKWKQDVKDCSPGHWVKQGDIYLVRDQKQYPNRLKDFSEHLYHRFLQTPYPLTDKDQGRVIPFWETGIEFFTLNSCWQIDAFHRKRSGISDEAVANAIRSANDEEKKARKGGKLAANKKVLRIAVWHHAAAGPEQMKDVTFVENLQKNGVKMALHGDVHEMRRDLVSYWDAEKKLHILGAGSFGASAEQRPESTPRLYNILQVSRDLKQVRVHTRQQAKASGPWDGWHVWSNPNGEGKLAYFDIDV